MTIDDARQKLENAGLHVSKSRDGKGLCIAATSRQFGDVKISQDMCVLSSGDENDWRLILPAEGMRTYDITGPLTDLLGLIEKIYSRYRGAGGELRNAVADTIPDAQRFLNGSTGPTRWPTVPAPSANGPGVERK